MRTPSSPCTMAAAIRQPPARASRSRAAAASKSMRGTTAIDLPGGGLAGQVLEPGQPPGADSRARRGLAPRACDRGALGARAPRCGRARAGRSGPGEARPAARVRVERPGAARLGPALGDPVDAFGRPFGAGGGAPPHEQPARLTPGFDAGDCYLGRRVADIDAGDQHPSGGRQACTGTGSGSPALAASASTSSRWTVSRQASSSRLAGQTLAAHELVLAEAVQRADRLHDQVEVLLGDEVLDLPAGRLAGVERALGHSLPVGVLEHAARDAAARLDPAADRQAAAGRSDPSQRKLQKLATTLLTPRAFRAGGGRSSPGVSSRPLLVRLYRLGHRC